MHRTSKLLLLLVVLSLIFAGCGGDDTADTTAATQAPETTTTTVAETTTTTVAETTTTTVAETTTTEAMDDVAVLSEYVTGQLAEWTPVMAADALYENLSDGDDSNDPFILSVRAPEHYALGHIPGAYNIPWKQLGDPAMLAALPTDRQIVTYCYTGHTGQVAATLLRLLGYDAINLKYGMMGWTADDEVLATARYTAAAGYPTQTEANALPAGDGLPVLDTAQAEGQAVALERIQSFLADWTPVMAADALFENLSDGDDSNDPFILSVRSPDDYALGHIDGAVNIPWKEVATMTSLDELPEDQNIVTYCYTGHTGQVAATTLAVMGYDVINLKFGMMGWTDDDAILDTARYSGPADYPLETEPNELP